MALSVCFTTLPPLVTVNNRDCASSLSLQHGIKKIHGFRWNESYKKDVFSSRIDTTRTLAQAIAASPNPPRSWVLITGVGRSNIRTALGS